jgi:hypothetical protein
VRLDGCDGCVKHSPANRLEVPVREIWPDCLEKALWEVGRGVVDNCVGSEREHELGLARAGDANNAARAADVLGNLNRKGPDRAWVSSLALRHDSRLGPSLSLQLTRRRWR